MTSATSACDPCRLLPPPLTVTCVTPSPPPSLSSPPPNSFLRPSNAFWKIFFSAFTVALAAADPIVPSFPRLSLPFALFTRPSGRSKIVASGVITFDSSLETAGLSPDICLINSLALASAIPPAILVGNAIASTSGCCKLLSPIRSGIWIGDIDTPGVPVSYVLLTLIFIGGTIDSPGTGLTLPSTALGSPCV